MSGRARVSRSRGGEVSRAGVGSCSTVNSDFDGDSEIYERDGGSLVGEIGEVLEILRLFSYRWWMCGRYFYALVLGGLCRLFAGGLPRAPHRGDGRAPVVRWKETFAVKFE